MKMNYSMNELFPPDPKTMHDVRITKATANLGVIIQCVRCPEKDTEAEYEWHDEDGTVYFIGNNIADLERFMVVHPTNQTMYL